MKKCDRCGIAPDVIEKHCKVINGKQFCYKKGGCAKCNVPEATITRYCRWDQYGTVCYLKDVMPKLPAPDNQEYTFIEGGLKIVVGASTIRYMRCES
jgi:hypothetical protein